MLPTASRESPPAETRVLVVDDIRVYREGLGGLLRRESFIGKVETAPPGDRVLGSIRDFSPDVVLLNVLMPDSIPTLRAIMSAFPKTKVVAFGVSETSDEVETYVEAGAAGYFSREGSLGDLSAVIQSVARGETLCSPRVAARLFRRMAALGAEQWPPMENPRLTRRETEIAQLIDQGLSNKEIAQRLIIDVYTVKNHVHNILEKLQVHRRGEAAARLRGVLTEARGRVGGSTGT
jgi:two-component system, NarL family, nitrate/nitrite response regulator NarL